MHVPDPDEMHHRCSRIRSGIRPAPVRKVRGIHRAGLFPRPGGRVMGPGEGLERHLVRRRPLLRIKRRPCRHPYSKVQPVLQKVFVLCTAKKGWHGGAYPAGCRRPQSRQGHLPGPPRGQTQGARPGPRSMRRWRSRRRSHGTFPYRIMGHWNDGG